MIQNKYEFYRKGVDNQKRPDVVVELKRMPVKAIHLWTSEEKKEAKEWLEQIRAKFDAFVRVIEAN